MGEKRRWILLKDLPIERAGTIITETENDYIVEGEDTPFPYSPQLGGEWFRELKEEFTYVDLIDFTMFLTDTDRKNATIEVDNWIRIRNRI